MNTERVIDRAERLRVASGLGKEEMASRIGVTVKTYNRHLSGETEAGNLKTFMLITSACDAIESEINEEARNTATNSGTKASTKPNGRGGGKDSRAGI